MRYCPDWPFPLFQADPERTASEAIDRLVTIPGSDLKRSMLPDCPGHRASPHRTRRAFPAAPIALMAHLVVANQPPQETLRIDAQIFSVASPGQS